MRHTTITITIPVEQARALLEAALGGLPSPGRLQALAVRGYRRLTNGLPS